MTKKNDIASFKNLKSKDILKKEDRNNTAVIGRPRKKTKERESFKIAFSLTQGEADILIKKAGRMSPNIFLKAYLREDTDLLK